MSQTCSETSKHSSWICDDALCLSLSDASFCYILGISEFLFGAYPKKYSKIRDVGDVAPLLDAPYPLALLLPSIEVRPSKMAMTNLHFCWEIHLFIYGYESVSFHCHIGRRLPRLAPSLSAVLVGFRKSSFIQVRLLIVPHSVNIIWIWVKDVKSLVNTKIACKSRFILQKYGVIGPVSPVIFHRSDSNSFRYTFSLLGSPGQARKISLGSPATRRPSPRHWRWQRKPPPPPRSSAPSRHRNFGVL